MRRSFGQSLADSLQRLDPESALRLRLFTFKLLAVAAFTMALSMPRGYPALPMLSVFCLWQSIFAALTAAFWRQKLAARSLTAWDETAAFIAIALLARLVGP